MAEHAISVRERSAAVAQIADAAPLRCLTASAVADEIAVLVLDGRAPATLPGARSGGPRPSPWRRHRRPCGKRSHPTGW
ncbi:hypothetical protein [Streptomyces sp. NPDC049915]|uniref:hypothetical protein n=1 Tax=Streptomyces sp. NPDC049915 TaxID=3155510 RepID=UPI0034345795